MAEDAHRHAVVQDCARSAVDQPLLTVRHDLDLDPQRLAQSFDDPLDVEEVDVSGTPTPVIADRRPSPGARHHSPLAAAPEESVADFEQADVAALPASVVSYRTDESRQDGWPQHAERGGEGVGDRHQVALCGERHGGGLFDEPERHGLGEACAGEHGPQPARLRDTGVRRRRRRCEVRERRR